MFFIVCFLFSNSTFPKDSSRNTIGVSNSLYPDQARRFVGPDLGPSFTQKSSADSTSRQRVNPACYLNRITLSILEINHYLSSYSTAESNGQCKIVLVDNGGLISLNRADLDPLCSRYGHCRKQTWPRGYNTFLCSTQLNMKFILFINVKMPTIIGILTFVSRINTISDSFITRKELICQHFSCYEKLKFHSQLR